MFGCVDTIGPQAGDIARTAWLAAGLPEAVPGVTVDRQCGSSQQAVHFAAQAVLSGTADLVVAGGVQNMSQIPIAAAMLAGQAFGFDDPFSGSDGWRARYGEQEISQFRGGRPDRREVGDRPRRDGGVRAGQPRAGGPRRSTAGAFAAEIVPYGEVTRGRVPAPGHLGGQDGRAGAAAARAG